MIRPQNNYLFSSGKQILADFFGFFRIFRYSFVRLNIISLTEPGMLPRITNCGMYAWPNDAVSTFNCISPASSDLRLKINSVIKF